MMTLSLFAVVLLALSSTASTQKAGPYTADATKDQILSLPGGESSKYPFGFSGYLQINGSAPNSKNLHYWLVESLSDPKNDPIAFWTNGSVKYRLLSFSSLSSKTSILYDTFLKAHDAGALGHT